MNRLSDRQQRLYRIFFFSSRRRHTRCSGVSWARRCVQETGTWGIQKINEEQINNSLRRQLQEQLQEAEQLLKNANSKNTWLTNIRFMLPNSILHKIKEKNEQLTKTAQLLSLALAVPIKNDQLPQLLHQATKRASSFKSSSSNDDHEFSPEDRERKKMRLEPLQQQQCNGKPNILFTATVQDKDHILHAGTLVEDDNHCHYEQVAFELHLILDPDLQKQIAKEQDNPLDMVELAYFSASNYEAVHTIKRENYQYLPEQLQLQLSREHCEIICRKKIVSPSPMKPTPTRSNLKVSGEDNKENEEVQHQEQNLSLIHI
eukprot:TRINITY_DN5093_c0_g1_i6.p1 TRINITY_DN5093_c0_g1~~TRINITY_DN5093_c0_g1_i6.p1  ORF type:complete len:317 (-),score=53.94 TRINITY_DN5093_c0_g1_i6:63-1013(-)